MQRIFLSLLLLMGFGACSPSSGSKDPGTPAPTFEPAPLPDKTIPAPIPSPEPAPLDLGSVTIPLLGSPDSLEFATWNMENFPKSNQSVALARTVFEKTAVDLFAVEEIADQTAFETLVRSMPGFKGLLSPHEYGGSGYQKLAFIYREADVELLDWELLFTGDAYVFPRPPLQGHFRIKTGAFRGTDIYLIVVHLKATDDNQSQDRREQANIQLEAHVSALRSRMPNIRLALLGDFNEKVTFADGLAVFNPWNLQPAAYTFQTKNMALAGEYSFISPSHPMLDHMISTRNIELNPITVPKLETMIPNYRDLMSDHLPVIARLR